MALLVGRTWLEYGMYGVAMLGVPLGVAAVMPPFVPPFLCPF